ncbi:hypothetical protein BDY19DRAFT_914675 [Irpex rosettiformis]|uniref:Uncharacterized protein n=1 Tax=Irpex rosettiformis TaxID=378272 RepID=A0ACB8UKR9_9APHY|nr:hypothetical protein BDY19DRAFT_914675 [Irpex rosettiformis]
MTQPSRRTPAKFYQEDNVRLADNARAYGVVVRCWHDAEDIPPPPEQLAIDPLMRPLKHGEVGVSFFTSTAEAPQREILPESKLILLDRLYQPGDLLKKSIDDVRSGIVTSIDVQGRLEHAISFEPIETWKTMDDMEFYIDVDMGDYVVYNDWVGQVVEMFDEAVVEMGSGALVRLPELSARLLVGERGPNILPPPTSGMQSLLGFFLGNARPSSQDTVLHVKRTVLAVAWLAINQSLNPQEAASRARPQRFWYGPDLGKLTLVRRRAEQAMRVGDRVVLKNEVGPRSTHGREGEVPGIIPVDTLVVRETHTRINVLWQDGVRETLDSKDTVPYLNPDEYDCWPGDHVIWKSEGQRRPAVVQSVNAVDRTAYIRFVDSNHVELASVLELDPHGSSDSPIEGLGLHRGEFVFIHKEGTTNGATKPVVPRIGELEAWVRESPIMHIHENGQLGGWRREMTEIGNDIAQRRGRDNSVEEGKLKRRPLPGDTSLNWFGEVVDLRLDGTIEVMLLDSSIVVLPLERLTRLHDGLDQLEDLWGDGSEQDSLIDEDVETWATNEQGEWVRGADGDDWSTDDDDNPMEVDDDGWSSSDPTALQSSSEAATSPPGVVTPDELNSPHTLSTRTQTPDIPTATLLGEDVSMRGASTQPNLAALCNGEDAETHWKRFEVLPSAPVDHAFYSSSPAQPSRTFLGRLNKEYRVLESSLPETILVRVYEDRTDLLRCLIIGPENTPYEDAPFVIDWMLDSNFPHSPPIAHFLSWTNGNGRVNPNLYEEGKVCLSILGTWAGDKNEIWSASRSSLLQAFVSIQGLVLVKEPWFCEPAYEKLRGTEEGIVNSRLYSEKAYVLSRGFVRRALEIPLGSLESEVNWLYYKCGKLQKVVKDARVLIEKSKSLPIEESTPSSSTADEPAVPRLTGGGIIALERTLAKLQALLGSQPSLS